MEESYVILVKYHEQEYGEVEYEVERVKFRMEEWLEHDVKIDEMEILCIENHTVTRYSGRDFISNF